jgi:hypothetical protein
MQIADEKLRNDEDFFNIHQAIDLRVMAAIALENRHGQAPSTTGRRPIPENARLGFKNKWGAVLQQ